MNIVRLLLSLAANYGSDLQQFDVKNVFLHGELAKEIYIEIPPGYEKNLANHTVYRLKAALYGLKQAGHLWNQKLHGVLQKLGFSRMKSDASVYVYSRAGVRIIIPIFVDDITLAGKSLSDIKKVIQELSQHFKLRDLGPTSYLLGLKVTRNRSAHSLSLSQHQYILNMLDTYRMSDCLHRRETPVRARRAPYPACEERVVAAEQGHRGRDEPARARDAA